MKRKISFMYLVFAIGSLLFFSNCKKSATNTDCAVAWSGTSYVQVINETNTKLTIKISAFGAGLDPTSCGRYGCNAGDNLVTIRSSSAEKNINYSVATGETYIITVTDDFFN